MKLCLAALTTHRYLLPEFYKCRFMLESFYSMRDWLLPAAKHAELFLLDSGAFTFMQSKPNVDFDDYLTQYIDFINRHDIEHFFELDVDSVVGIGKVEKLRERLERETGKQSIPVWHKSRGKDYFVSMCKEYNYVAIGGIAIKAIKPNEYKYFRWFIDTAHEYGCRIHGLGFTNLDGLYVYNFDSVDSTSWKSGGRFGTLYFFDGKSMKTIDTGKRRRRDDIGIHRIDRWNYNEWIQFQNYADKNL